MNDTPQDLIDWVRREYFAPTYERLVFETNDLMQKSDGDVDDYREDDSREVDW